MAETRALQDLASSKVAGTVRRGINRLAEHRADLGADVDPGGVSEGITEATVGGVVSGPLEVWKTTSTQ